MIIHSDIIQGSEEWYKIRLGRVTASQASCVLAKGRDGGKSKGRKGYMVRLAAERLTGECQESFKNANMDWGSEQEDAARRHYEAIMGVEVKQVGFITHSEDVGCSPDGLIGKDGMAQYKCPLTTTHIEYLLSGKFPSVYNAQVQMELWVAERKWSDFCSYDPRMRSNKMFKIRVYRDDEYIDNLEKEVDKFVTELKALVNTIGQSPF